MTDTTIAVLQQSNLFDFVDGVRDAKMIEGLVDLNQADRYGGLLPLVDHIGIAAAELAVVESGTVGEWTGYPVTVASRHLALASLKYDCTLGNLCVPSVPSESWILDLVSVFSADVARLWRILERHGGFAKLSNGPKELHSIIGELEGAYAEHPSEAVGAFLERKCVRVQGLLWRMQLTTASYPGFEGDPNRALRGSGEALGLLSGS
ncbi:hypothetical protein ACIP4Y_26610 [Streptomyces sp. NPDC088810]|uniref:hypothetical protein n=1 Tax=Streptomyces sp. NPDC088810 TaxID=3365904 RepID=UPI003806AFF7